MKPLEVFWIFTNKIETAIIYSFVAHEKENKTSKIFINILMKTSTKTKSKASSVK